MPGDGMGAGATESVFAPYHVAVAAVYFAAVLVFTMASMNPACVAVALAGSLAASVLLRGAAATAGTLRWLLPLWAVIAIVNSCYSSSQAANTASLGPVTVGLESLCYGLTAGAMITAVVLWFAAAGECIASDAAVGLLASMMPTVALMISQVLRLVPQMLRRGREVLDVQDACRPGAGAPPGAHGDTGRIGAGAHMRAGALRDRARVVSVLVGWSMEDAAIRAESMRARGFGAHGMRTRYRVRRFRSLDAVLVAAVGACGVAACASAALVGAQFQFYPVVGAQGSIAACWACLPGVPLAAVVPLLAARNELLP